MVNSLARLVLARALMAGSESTHSEVSKRIVRRLHQRAWSSFRGYLRASYDATALLGCILRCSKTNAYEARRGRR